MKSLNALQMGSLVVVAALAGCGLLPGKVRPKAAPVEYAGPVAVQGAVHGRLAVNIAPDDLDRTAHADYGSEGFWYEDGKIMQRAAIASFGQVFTQASTCERAKVADVVAKVRGNSFFNPLMRTYYAHVVTTFYLGNGEPLGKFVANGDVTGPPAYDAAVEKAYAIAFGSIGTQLLRSEKLIAAVQKGLASTASTKPCSF